MQDSILSRQLDTLLAAYSAMRAASQYPDLSDIPTAERQSLVTRSLGAIERIGGPQSLYNRHVHELVSKNRGLHQHIHDVLGVVQALRDDLNAGFLQTYAEVVHAEVFSDLLDRASHLNNSGYKDASAVIAGSTLEGHLRELAKKNAIPIADNGRAVKAEKLNADLAKAGIYGLLDQKAVTAFLDLRNKAAHGEYAAYTKEQVSQLISGVEDFIKRTPA